ncbi:hypothetical protein BGZ94_008920 [Podila epigama]|nr:hypothetical protein BGZ94_008920 [Podila epigama]
MENAKATIKDLEKIIKDQAESHKNKMCQLYDILQATQDQVDKLVSGLQKATLFESRPPIVQTRSHTYSKNVPSPSSTRTPSLPYTHLNIRHFPDRNTHYVSNESNWRNTIESVYVDAEEEHESEWPDSEPERETAECPLSTADAVLSKHLSDLEKLKQMYFFSMALSVKMNREMLGTKTVEYTSKSVQSLYEDCTQVANIPVEGWPGYVSRYFTAHNGAK